MSEDEKTLTVTPLPAVPQAPPTAAAEDRRFCVLGVSITDVSRGRAVELLEGMIRRRDGRTRSVFFVNSHTLNLAAADEQFRWVLGSADHVFGDGTGVRWAARLQGIRLRDNLVGTDLVPALLSSAAGHRYRYFLLGAGKRSMLPAAQYAAARFTGWVQAGYHHGFLHTPKLCDEVIRQINDSRADLLLVGMGNPLQEQWINAHRQELNVPLAVGVGGLFDYWAGNIHRTPAWLRRCGAEWLGILWQQPHKAARYLLGNPLFVARVLREQREQRHPRQLGRVLREFCKRRV